MNEVIRVVHITTVHHPFDTRIYHKQCKTLAANGFEVYLITTYHDDLELINKDSPIKVIALPKAKNRFLRMTRSAVKAYCAAKKLKAKFYHFHDPELIPVGILLKKQSNIVVYDVHEDYVTSIRQKEYLSPCIRSIIARVFGFVEKSLTKKFAICLAEKYYKERFPEGECILNYPVLNGQEQIVERPTGHNDLIYTGGITEDRGALIHARIPLLVDGVQVHLAGICSSDTAEKMYDVAGRKKENVLITGIERYVAREEIDEMYFGKNWLAGLALFPPTKHYMKKELTKFFEYMYAGLPIICSNFPAWQSFIEKYKCGITVDPLNEVEIKNAIIFLRNNPEIRAAMGKNGRDAIINELNWLKEGKKLVKWYKGMVQ